MKYLISDLDTMQQEVHIWNVIAKNVETKCSKHLDPNSSLHENTGKNKQVKKITSEESNWT